jgi:hypothetical protein
VLIQTSSSSSIIADKIFVSSAIGFWVRFRCSSSSSSSVIIGANIACRANFFANANGATG